MIRPPPRSTLFPYPPLFRSRRLNVAGASSSSGTTTCAVITAQTPASTAARNGSSAAARSPATTGNARCESTDRSEEHTSELQSRQYLVCRLLLEKKKKKTLQ